MQHLWPHQTVAGPSRCPKLVSWQRGNRSPQSGAKSTRRLKGQFGALEGVAPWYNVSTQFAIAHRDDVARCNDIGYRQQHSSYRCSTSTVPHW